MPLSMAKKNSALKVIGLNGSPDLKQRLQELGFVKGATITVIQDTKNGSMLIKLLESKLVLSMSTAHNVLVG